VLAWVGGRVGESKPVMRIVNYAKMVVSLRSTLRLLSFKSLHDTVATRSIARRKKSQWSGLWTTPRLLASLRVST